MFTIPTANDLVTFIKDFTGSTNDEEVKKCIFMAEMSMRNIELPALRCDPYAPENIGMADAFGRVAIPGDMNKPILFFKQGQQYLTQAQATGVVGESTITLITTPTKSLQVGMVVSGSGIASGATIVGFPSPDYSVVTLSAPNTGEVSGIVLFQTLPNKSSQTGPWIVYDRIGDRDIITQGMIAQLYLQPVNVPAVIRGKFSEVGQYYEFLPYVAEGDLINMYYYKAWPLLFSPINDQVISETSYLYSFTVTGVDSWDVGINSMTSTSGLTVGDVVRMIPPAGSPGSIGNTNLGTVKSIDSDTSMTLSVVSTFEPRGGDVGPVVLFGMDVQSNAVLATWPEGYVYATLREYYIKRHNSDDAAVYQAKFQDAWNVIEDQNNLGKWSGGHTRMSSIWQPRQYRQYNIK